MRGQVAHVAVGPPGAAPVEGRGRIGQEILGMLEPQPGDIAQRSLRNQLTGELRGRRAGIVEARHVRHARRLGRRDHGAGVGEGVGQRLFAEDGLAPGKGRLGDLAVGLLRRGDDDGLDARIIDERPPVRRGAGEPEGGAIAFGTFGAGGGDHFQPRAQAGFEDGTDRGHGHGMRLAHVAAADDADADLGHVSSCLWPARLVLQPVAKAVSLRSHRRNTKSGDRMANLDRLHGKAFLVIGRAGMDLYADPPGTRSRRPGSSPRRWAAPRPISPPGWRDWAATRHSSRGYRTMRWAGSA